MSTNPNNLNRPEQDPKAIHDVMGDESLRKLVERAQIISTLMPKLMKLLPWELSGQYVVMNVRNGVIVLGVPNGAIATRMQYNEFELLSMMDRDPDLAHIEKIAIKVRPDLFIPSKDKFKPKREISPHAQNLLTNVADHIDDEALQNALRKLASHTK